MRQPRLASPHVILLPLTEADREALFAVAADPLIWEQHPYHDRWQPRMFNAFFDDCLGSGGGLVAIDPHTKAIIGASRFDTERASTNEVEIGWTFLARSHWGTRTNPAMKALMITHALEHYERVIFIIGENNRRSRRAIEKIGAVLTPRTDILTAAGQPVVHVIYAMDKATFAASPIAPLA